MKQQKVVMVGPALDDLGGISRVVKTWYDSGFFTRHDVIYLPTTSVTHRNLLALLRAFSRYLLCLTLYDSVVYVHTSSRYGFYRKAIFLSAGALLRAKVLLHVHPTHFRDFLQELTGVKRALVSYLLHRVTAFAVLTESMAEFIQERFPQKPVYVLPNAINVKGYRCNGAVHRQDNNLLYLGWYVRAKGVYDLVDSIELMVGRGEDVNVDFYGTKEVADLQRYVESKNLQSRIKIHGWIGQEEKLQALYTHSLLVLPSYSEGMPNVILEAMATRIPIVSTSVGGLQEVLVDGENAVVVKAGDPNDLAEKISNLLKDGELRKRISEKAFEEVNTRFDADVIRAKFFKILADVTSR